MNNDGTPHCNISHNANKIGVEGHGWTQIVFESLQDEYSRAQLYIMNLMERTE